MRHYKIVVSLNLPDYQKEQLEPFLSNVRAKKFNSLGLAKSYVKRVENQIGQCYRNFYSRYYCHGGDIFVCEYLFVGWLDRQDIALIGIQEVES